MAQTALTRKSSKTLARTRHPRPRRDGAWPKGQALARQNLTGVSVQPREVGGLARYAELRRRVRATLLWGQQAIEEARVRTYWETGWWIKEHVLLNQFRADYGQEVLLKLSRDEGIDKSVLHRCVLFSEKFPDLFPKPIVAARPKSFANARQTSKKRVQNVLTWTHYRTLLPLEDDKLRHRLAREAARYGWTVPELEARIKSVKKSLPAAQGPLRQIALLQPQKGELFTYRIVEDRGVPALDHGFAKYWNLSGEEAMQFREGDIVRKPPGGKMEKVEEGSKSLLYTYEADVTRVVDGDTIWMKIYLEGRGSPPWVKEKLRLRDIDAPEIKTPEGRAAKKFVEDAVAGKQVILTTTKPDKWDRYLSDVFLIPASGEGTRAGNIKISPRSPQSKGIEEIYLNNLLLEKGHARVKTHWSLDDWEA